MLAPSLERSGVREERGYATRMQKHDRFSGRDLRRADIPDERCHCLRRVHRIEQDAFVLGDDSNRLEALRRGNSVALSDVPLIGHQLLRLNRDLRSKQGGGLVRDARRANAFLVLSSAPSHAAQALWCAEPAGPPLTA